MTTFTLPESISRLVSQRHRELSWNWQTASRPLKPLKDWLSWTDILERSGRPSLLRVMLGSIFSVCWLMGGWMATKSALFLGVAAGALVFMGIVIPRVVAPVIYFEFRESLAALNTETSWRSRHLCKWLVQACLTTCLIPFEMEIFCRWLHAGRPELASQIQTEWSIDGTRAWYEEKDAEMLAGLHNLLSDPATAMVHRSPGWVATQKQLAEQLKLHAFKRRELLGDLPLANHHTVVMRRLWWQLNEPLSRQASHRPRPFPEIPDPPIALSV